jgi:hypothetical protein
MLAGRHNRFRRKHLGYKSPLRLQNQLETLLFLRIIIKARLAFESAASASSAIPAGVLKRLE